jgi:ribonuclease H / adenosylcobalamin/alpha-ribazole phosphatase
MDPNIMSDNSLREIIIETLWSVFSGINYVLSTTITGSFSKSIGLDGISDIDTIVIVSDLTEEKFIDLQEQAYVSLEPIFSINGYKLKINPTLGPLKINDSKTAVLHLMVYDILAHREHVIQSPFTCYDWQRSPLYLGYHLKEIYPVFALQPRHFISARRSSKDYLKDLESDKISFRKIIFENEIRKEINQYKQMTLRDHHEFAYHIIRFLMQNYYKLVKKSNFAPEGDKLLDFYTSAFSVNKEHLIHIYKTLQKMKSSTKFGEGIDGLKTIVSRFVQEFENNFSEEFSAQATRHVFFRHAQTHLNTPIMEDTIFLGRTDVQINQESNSIPGELTMAIEQNNVSTYIVSPLRRTMETVKMLGSSNSSNINMQVSRELIEIDYGSFEGKTLRETRNTYSEVFKEWAAGRDPKFPGGGENYESVINRLHHFLASDKLHTENSAVCTHNVVLRCLIGDHFNIPQSDWYRLRIPHMMPIIVIYSKKYGYFIEMDEDVERAVFEDFLIKR